ncbi:MAG TPA: hypothetical protein VGE57_10990 [Solimonas sp.]
MSARRYWRRVTPMERLAMVVHQAYRYHVDGVLECEGQVDPEQLRAAVARAAECNPGLRVRLRGRSGWSRWIDSGIAPAVRVLACADWDGDSDRGADFLEAPFDVVGGGAIADVLLVPCRDGRTRLVFRTAHAAVDGRGCMHWMTEVLRAMRGEPLVGAPSSLTDTDIHRRYREQLPARQQASQAAPTCLSVLAPSSHGRQPLRYLWRRISLNRSVSHLLPKVAIFLAQWARRESQGPIAFTIPVDYRGLRTPELGTGNLTGYLRLDVDEAATPRTLMKQLNDRIREFADCRTFPGADAMRWLPLSLLQQRMRPMDPELLYRPRPGAPSGGLVSMGTFRLSDYDGPGFRACGIYGIPGAVGRLNVLFGNTDRGAQLLFTAPAAYNADGQLDTMIEALQRRFSGGPADSPADGAAS